MCSRSSKVNGLYLIWKPVCYCLLVMNSNLGPVLHRLATIHPWQTDRQTDERQLMPIARSLLKYGRLKSSAVIEKLCSERYCKIFVHNFILTHNYWCRCQFKNFRWISLVNVTLNNNNSAILHPCKVRINLSRVRFKSCETETGGTYVAGKMCVQAAELAAL